MHFSADTLDDLLRDVLQELLQRPFNLKTSRGVTSEIIGTVLTLKNPRARLSRTETKGTIFSALGELLWYLSQKTELDFISYYIPHYKKETEDGKTIYGGYGPRLFAMDGQHNQVENVIKLLQNSSTSRRAAIQLFDAKDIADDHTEIPCTCILQFLVRDSQLHMVTYMRSNDAFWGLPHDVFAFTMIQEIISRALNIEIGTYSHCVGSLHLYEHHKTAAEEYINEGVQSTKRIMPSMPMEDPWPAISTIINAEEQIRNSKPYDTSQLTVHDYWKDLIKILQIFALYKKGDVGSIKEIQSQLSSLIYNTYIDKKIHPTE